jgi:hypothetical protein
MNWINLKEERCPKCGAYLNKREKYYCKFCNFNIEFGKVVNILNINKNISLEKEANELLKNSKIGGKKRRR